MLISALVVFKYKDWRCVYSFSAKELWNKIVISGEFHFRGHLGLTFL